MRGAATPDLILVGAIATLEGRRGYGWQEAIAIGGGRVVASGERRRIAELAGPSTRILRLAPDEAVLPGLTDAHLHLGLAALAAGRVDLSRSDSLAAGLDAIRLHAERAPERDGWIEGSGWDPARWGAWPTADALEQAVPGRIVALWSHDHHALLLSRAALKAVGIDGRLEDPPGGMIRRTDRGEPDGVLQERAVALAAARLPASDPAQLDEAIARYATRLVAAGIVAVHDPGPLLPDPDLQTDMAACARLDERGRLPLRVHVCVREESLATARERGLRGGAALAPGPSLRTIERGEARGPHCRVGWLKLFADGALGSRTAALIEPYEHDRAAPDEPPDWRGVATLSRERLRELVTAAVDAGIASEVHAIGDAAVRLALDVLGDVPAPAPASAPGAALPSDAGPGHRIEHVQLLAAADAARFAESHVAASVQPLHLRSDAAPARRAWGERAEERGYPYGTLVRAGARLAFGSDAPVEEADPWAALAFAALRRPPGSAAPAFGAGQRLTLADALRASCVGPAMLAGETDRGRLVPGHRADLVIVPRAPFADPAGAEAVGSVLPRAVLIDGETVAGELA